MNPLLSFGVSFIKYILWQIPRSWRGGIAGLCPSSINQSYRSLGILAVGEQHHGSIMEGNKPANPKGNRAKHQVTDSGINDRTRAGASPERELAKWEIDFMSNDDPLGTKTDKWIRKAASMWFVLALAAWTFPQMSLLKEWKISWNVLKMNTDYSSR